jgi:chromate transporter
LGLTSFGGPVAHLGYFHEAFVHRKKWLSAHEYADIVALCQALPGPASSQVGMSIGLLRGGVSGSVAAWLGFTLPSAFIMILLSMFVNNLHGLMSPLILRGLKLAAVVVVIHALVFMAKSLCPDPKRKILALLVAAPLLVVSHTALQIALIILGGILGAFWLPETASAAELPESSKTSDVFRLSRRFGVVSLSLLVFLLVSLPILSAASNNTFVSLFEKFFRVGALIFGGGHVVLPLLATEFVDTKWVAQDLFLSGYGAAQAIPGPLFSFAGFIGAAVESWQGGIIALVAVFLPSFLVVFGVLPFWNKLKELHRMRRALSGVNAAVVGLLLAALIHPVGSTAIKQTSDVVIVATGLGLMFFGRAQSWIVVLLCTLLAVLNP